MGRHARAARRARLEGDAHDHPRQRRRSARRRADARSDAGRRTSTAASPRRASATCASRRSGRRTADQVKTQIAELAKGGATKLIVDVRRASSGTLDDGLALARLFVGQGHAGDARNERRRDAKRSPPRPATASITLPTALLDRHRHVRRRGALRVGARRQQARRPHRRAHDRPRRACRSWSSCPTAAACGSRRRAISRLPGTPLHEKGLEPTVAVDEPDVEFGQPAPTTDPILDKALERLARKKPRNGKPLDRRALNQPDAADPDSVILSVRLTPVFSRCRRVAQRLERLLDTQEVGGSSPPVPTMSSFAPAVTTADADELKPRASRHSPNESGHRHASGWLESHCASRHARPRRRGRDLSAASPRRRWPASSTASWSI